MQKPSKTYMVPYMVSRMLPANLAPILKVR